MKLKTIAIAAVAVAACAPLAATQYRLKTSVTVDVIEGGRVVGKQTLKRGSIVTVEEDAEIAEGQKKPLAPAGVGKKIAKLVPSNMSNAMFQTQQPPKGATFRAELRLSSFYVGPFSGQESKYWAVDVSTKTEDWSYDDDLYGYAPKSLDVGKRLSVLLNDGKDHRCIVHVIPVRDAYYKDVVKIVDFEEYEP